MLSRVALLLICVVAATAVEVVVPDAAKAIESQYILIFKNGVTDQQKGQHLKTLYKNFTDDFDNRIIHQYGIGDYKGFAARLSPRLLADQKSSSLIEYIEQDTTFTIAQTCNTQNGATWGINRLSDREINLNGQYLYGNTGTGVDSYIVDTGILTTHVDFGGRAIWGANFVDNTNTDCNGHGTHVAGTVGSNTYGVAKKTSLIAVKVLDCAGSGSNSGVIAGINWVVTSQKSRKRPSAANMSLGGGKSAATNNAVAAAVSAGITFAVAAGNEDQNACNVSPASTPTAITVGATATSSVGTKQVDTRSYFSNYGTCVSIFAPGSEITSTWIGSNTAINTISGTSMASPHIAGMAALYLQSNPSATPATIKSAMITESTKNIIQLGCASGETACNQSPNALAFSPCNP